MVVSLLSVVLVLVEALGALRILDLEIFVALVDGSALVGVVAC